MMAAVDDFHLGTYFKVIWCRKKSTNKSREPCLLFFLSNLHRINTAAIRSSLSFEVWTLSPVSKYPPRTRVWATCRGFHGIRAESIWVRNQTSRLNHWYLEKKRSLVINKEILQKLSLLTCRWHLSLWWGAIMHHLSRVIIKLINVQLQAYQGHHGKTKPEKADDTKPWFIY